MLLHNLSDKRYYNIDIAIDCYFDIVNSDIINNRVHKKRVHYNKSKVETVYFGSRKSGKVTVFYDKKAESPKIYQDYDVVNRLEVRLYGSQANNLLNKDFSKLLNGYTITKLAINDSLALKSKSLTTTQKLQIKEYIHHSYGIAFSKQERYKIKQLINKLEKTDFKPLFDEILKQSESTIKAQLQGFIYDELIELQEVA